MINWKTQIWKQLCAKCGALSHICCFQCFTHTQKHKHRAERGGSISGPCFFFDLLLSGCVDLRLIPPLRCSSSFPCLPPARVAQMSPLFTADREGRANEVLATRKLLSCMFHLPHAVQFTLVSQDIRLCGYTCRGISHLRKCTWDYDFLPALGGPVVTQLRGVKCFLPACWASPKSIFSILRISWLSS